MDRLSLEEQMLHYPELKGEVLTSIDIIDDGEKLSSFADESIDFIIASHFLEHCQDPIGTLENFNRVLRQEGHVLLAIPDKRYTFDKERPTTTLNHLCTDHKEGPEVSREAHFEEWSRYVGQKKGDELQADINHCTELGYSIHFHVWTEKELKELIMHISSYLPLTCIEFQLVGEEILVVLNKQGKRRRHG